MINQYDKLTIAWIFSFDICEKKNRNRKFCFDIRYGAFSEWKTCPIYVISFVNAIKLAIVMFYNKRTLFW